jgi:cytochrome c oxidase cbb3-type subunit 4
MVAGITTLVLMILFLAGVAWAFSRKRKPEFDAAARLPLEDQSENTP